MHPFRTQLKFAAKIRARQRRRPNPGICPFFCQAIFMFMRRFGNSLRARRAPCHITYFLVWSRFEGAEGLTFLILSVHPVNRSIKTCQCLESTERILEAQHPPFHSRELNPSTRKAMTSLLNFQVQNRQVFHSCRQSYGTPLNRTVPIGCKNEAILIIIKHLHCSPD